MKKLVIFDMGNTLLDFHCGLHTDDEKDMLGLKNMSEFLKESYDIVSSVDQIKSLFLDKWYGDFHMREQLIELDVSLYVEDFIKSIDKTHVKVDSVKLMRAFYDPYINEVVANEGVHEVLLNLSEHYHIGVISNCILYDEFYIEVFEKLGLSKYIDKFVFSYSRQIRKPDKRLFLEMLTHFGVSPKDAYMIGDSPDADIKPAIELGMKTLQYRKADKPLIGHYIFSHFNEIPSIIFNNMHSNDLYKYVVTIGRKSEFPNPITVKKDELVECLQESDSNGEWAGWVLCRTKDNEGWIPKQIIHTTDDNAGIIEEDYCAEEFDLEVGEVLYSKRNLNGWIWCYKEGDASKYAWAPLMNLDELY